MELGDGVEVHEIIMEPCPEVLGSFVIDQEKDRDEELKEMMEMLIKKVDDEYEWDSPAELWFVLAMPEKVAVWKAMRVVQGHIKYALPAIPAIPEYFTGIMVLCEGWGLNSEVLEKDGEKWDDWTGRIADHPAAVETRVITYYDGENFYEAYQIRDVSIDTYLTKKDGAKEVMGAVPGAMVQLMEKSVAS